jgi:hypothetical protein
MAKSWREKHDNHKHAAHVKRTEKPFAGLPRGATIVIATPKDVSAYIRKIPSGKTRSMAQLRAALAKKYGADAACPLTTGIFTRIASEFAYEQIELGAKPSEVASFWRLVDPKSPLAKKLTCGPAFIETLRAEESHAPPKKAAKKAKAARR